MNQCIANVAVNPPYPRGQVRLIRSLSKVGYKGEQLLWTNKYPPESPDHKEIPYAFKCFALKQADERGHELVLWCDSSVQFLKSPDAVFSIVRSMGYYFMDNEWNVGQWCSDAALGKLELTREAAFGIPLVLAGFFGLDLKSEIGRVILARMLEHAKDGSFRGAWTNEHGEVSADKRVLGHRHDMTVLSVVVHRLGVTLDKRPGLVTYYHKERGIPEGTVALISGIDQRIER